MLPKQKQLVLVDSLQTRRTEKMLEIFAQAIWPLVSDTPLVGGLNGIRKAKWEYQLCLAPVQPDSINCGTCVCANVELLLRNLRLEDIDYEPTVEFFDRKRMLITKRLLMMSLTDAMMNKEEA